MIEPEAILGLPGYQISRIEWESGAVRISARYTGPISCPWCGGSHLRSKGRYVRREPLRNVVDKEKWY